MKYLGTLLAFSATLLLTGCTLTAPKADDAAMQTGANDQAVATGDTANAVTTGDAENAGNTANTGTAAADANAEAPRVITVNAKRWAYTPNTITVKKGEKVALAITNEDTTHGIKFANMNTTTNADGTVTLDTSTAGTYEFFCPTFCGEGHKDMKGTVIVTE